MSIPLQGVKILDFTTLLPGPYATMFLADLGASVLKICAPTRSDLSDILPPFVKGTNISAQTAFLGRGKRAINLDLKIPGAVEVVHRLIKNYDVVIEQFRPGVMAKLCLSYDHLRKINPAVIYCSLTGYGQTGPWSLKAGHDINYLALSGLMAYSGKKETGPPLMGMQIADVASGSYNSIIGILAAVIHRHKTGQGQYIDISMTDGAIAFNACVAANFLVDSIEPEREALLLNGGSLYDFYETKDEKYMSFGALEVKFFEAFCYAINRPDLIPGGIQPENIEKIKPQIVELFKTKTREEWVQIFRDMDVCVEPVLPLSESLTSEHTQARELIIEVELPSGDKVRQLANPIKLSETPATYGKAGVVGGVHTKEIIMELGYSEDEYQQMKDQGLFG